MEAISISGFKGKLLTTTLKYNSGFGSPMAGYKYGTAHVGGYAILISDDGSKMLKANYYIFAGSCWDNKSSENSKKEATTEKSVAEKILRSITISGVKSNESASAVGTNIQQSFPSPIKSTVYPDPKGFTTPKLRQEIIRELTTEPATSKEVKYWTDREKIIKQPTVVTPTKTETIIPNNASMNSLVGNWDLVANGFAGILEITKVSSKLQGRVFYNVYKRWEPLEDVQFNATTGKLTFYRPEAKQNYEATLNGTTLTGTFNKTSKWTAKKTAGTIR